MKLNDKFNIRPVSHCDYMDVFNMLNNKNVTKYLNFIAMNNLRLAKETVHDLYLNKLRHKNLTMSIVNSLNDEVVGIIGYYKYRKFEKSAEIEFYLNEPYMNKGIMSMALPFMIKYGFNELKLDKIYISHTKENSVCKKLIVKNNFTFDYIVKNYRVKHNYRSDVFHYYLKKINFEGE